MTHDPPSVRTAVGGGPRTRRFPVIRPDQTIFRSYRAQAPDPAWKLIAVNGQEVRRRRLWLDLGSQRDLASLLSTPEYEVTQPEINDMEHGGSWINVTYLHRLALALECDPDVLIDNPDAPHLSADLSEDALREPPQ